MVLIGRIHESHIGRNWTFINKYLYIYIYIYIEREREREVHKGCTNMLYSLNARCRLDLLTSANVLCLAIH